MGLGGDFLRGADEGCMGNRSLIRGVWRGGLFEESLKKRRSIRSGALGSKDPASSRSGVTAR